MVVQEGGGERLRLFVLGDSLAEGVADVGTDALVVPFPEHLARRLRLGGHAVTTGSAARRGAGVRDGATRQCGRAEAFRPDLVVLWLGLNDLLRLGHDAAETAALLRGTAARLRAGGATLLTASMPSPDVALTLPGWSVRRLADRVRSLNATVAAVAAENAAVHLDVGGTLERVGRDRMIGPDGVHLTAVGHHAVALDYLDLLVARGVVRGGDAGRAEPAPGVVDLTSRDRALWLVTRGARYAARRAAGGLVRR